MTTTRAELGFRIKAFRKEIGRASAIMLGGMGACFGLCVLLFALVEKNALPVKLTVYIVWGFVPLMFVLVWHFDRRAQIFASQARITLSRVWQTDFEARLGPSNSNWEVCAM